MPAQNLSYSVNASLAVSGIIPTPATAPTQSVTLSAPYAINKLPADDYVANTYTINAGTTATALNLGKIAAGEVVMVTTTGTMMLTIVQASGSPVVQVDSFILLASGFTALSVANPGATAIYVNVDVIGDRVPVGTSPGVF